VHVFITISYIIWSTSLGIAVIHKRCGYVYFNKWIVMEIREKQHKVEVFKLRNKN